MSILIFQYRVFHPEDDRILGSIGPDMFGIPTRGLIRPIMCIVREYSIMRLNGPVVGMPGILAPG